MENLSIPSQSWSPCVYGKVPNYALTFFRQHINLFFYFTTRVTNIFQSLDEMKNSLLYATFELETTRMAAQDEILKRDEEIRQLKDLLSRAIKERDEAIDKYQRLSGTAQEDDGRSEEESIVCGSPVPSMEAAIGPLPEKGKLLQAVMEAGPLLQTLLLAGPLPEWRHPPPPLDAVEIPPVAISVDGHVDRSVGERLGCSRRS